MKHPFLMTPGPSPLAPEVKQALSKDIIHHRTAEFRSILKEVHSGLKYVFQTQNPVLVLSSSGTGAMEAAVTNLLSRNDKILVVVGGKFGQRWQEICQSYSLNVVSWEIEWGSSPSAIELENLLDKHSDIKAVFTTLCETSTATVYDIEATAKVCRQRDILLIVDAISGLGSDVLKTDEWGVDVVVAGSQKGLMLPPGLSFISLSPKAQAALETSNLPHYYFDLKKALKSYAKDDTPYTASVSLVIALREALKLIKNEGIEKRWEDFSRIGEALRRALETLGFGIFSRSPSASVTAGEVKSMDASLIIKKMASDFGITIAGGQAELKGKIIRIAHMGYINASDVLTCLAALEEVVQSLGKNIERGKSLKTFQEAYCVQNSN